MLTFISQLSSARDKQARRRKLPLIFLRALKLRELSCRCQEPEFSKELARFRHLTPAMKPLEPLQVPAKEVDIVTEKASDPQHPNNGQIEDSDRTLNKETDSDEEVEEAWQAVGVVEDTKPDEGPAEDWESEITEPHFVVNKRAYLYGKDVFVPSDIHAVSYRRRTPWYQPVEGQFDDADS